MTPTTIAAPIATTTTGNPTSAASGKPSVPVGANTSITNPQTEPLNTIADPLERSIPPAIITIAAPRAKIPSKAV